MKILSLGFLKIENVNNIIEDFYNYVIIIEWRKIMVKEQYHSKLEQANENLKIYQQKSNRLSLYRLISFFLFLGLLVGGFFGDCWLCLIFSVFFFMIFISFIFNHRTISNKVRYYRFMIMTLNEYLSRYDERWKLFEDGGEDFTINEENVFLSDLDIIGPTSLFKYINVCKTYNGRNKLFHRLSNRHVLEDELLNDQLMIKELAENIDFSLDFQIALKEYAADTSKVSLVSATKNINKDVHINRVHYYVVCVFIVLMVISFFLSLLQITRWYFFLEIGIMQLLYSTFLGILYKGVFVNISDISIVLGSLEKVFKTIKNQTFENTNLLNHKEQIEEYGLKGIKQINKIKEIDSYRMNFITNVIFNGLFSLNFFILLLYKDYQKKYGNKINFAINSLEEFEVQVSLAIIPQIKSILCLPNVSENMDLSFKNLMHPLLSETQCIDNSFNLDGRINIITGSNMSGKTFFLRTIGINLILMNAGTYVNGTSFSSSYLKVFTSMRIFDDISKGLSTFYAELLRIKNAITYAKMHKPMVVFVDEVFKGTNSNDRIQGAISLIKQLDLPNVILFITTHDFELCSIENVNMKNYHFSEHYLEDKIVFDYKLKEGRCTTTNAKYLMKIVGIVE